MLPGRVWHAWAIFCLGLQPGATAWATAWGYSMGYSMGLQHGCAGFYLVALQAHAMDCLYHGCWLERGFTRIKPIVGGDW